MSTSISCLRGFKNLTLYSALGSVRPNIGQGLSRYCTNKQEEKLSNIAKVARQYKEIFENSYPGAQSNNGKNPKDRRDPIPVETSILYLKTYHNTYGTEPVWVPYRRNFKGQIPPYNTRFNCVGRNGFLRTCNPCPICRDEYLVLHYKNVALLKQFISPQHGGTYPNQKTNLCRHQHNILLTAVMEAKELGLLTYDVPLRVYNYDQYKPKKGSSTQ